MNRFIFILGIILLTGSCNTKKDSNICRYDSDKLLSQIDTAMLNQKKFPDEDLYEIIDKGSNTGVRGIYKFDKDRTLRFYAFLLNDNNDYTFSREYDSLGALINSTGGEVIQWYFRKFSEDSVKITFYLYGINQTYNDLYVKLGNSDRIRIDLFRSPIFSNVFGGSIVSKVNKVEKGKIFLTGKKMNTCLKSVYSFSDSTEFPVEL